MRPFYLLREFTSTIAVAVYIPQSADVMLKRHHSLHCCKASNATSWSLVTSNMSHWTNTGGYWGNAGLLRVHWLGCTLWATWGGHQPHFGLHHGIHSVKKPPWRPGLYAAILKASPGSPLSWMFFSTRRRKPSGLKTSSLVPVPKKTTPSGLNDYWPVALTSHVMKVPEGPVSGEIIGGWVRVQTSVCPAGQCSVWSGVEYYRSSTLLFILYTSDFRYNSKS